MDGDLLRALGAELMPIATALNAPVYDPLLLSNTTPDKTHWRVSVMPAEPMANDICGQSTRQFIVAQVSIYMRDGQGSLAFDPHINALRDAMSINKVLARGAYSFRISKPIYIAAPVASANNGWVFRPAQITFDIIF